MKIAVLGAGGLIGHKLFEKLSRRFGDSVFACLHRCRREYAAGELFDNSRVFENVDVLDFDGTTSLLDSLEVDVVLNCVGITKRRPEVKDAVTAISINSLFPHKLAAWAGKRGRRVFQFSTDCVFNGKEGPYNEDSPTTGEDEYGRTKALGELRYDHCLTIRSSFIGRELSEYSELLEWFLGQQGPSIKGFTEAYYSGISTIEMARIVGDLIEFHPDLGGLYQLATDEPISKYDLLCEARRAFQKDIEIIPDSEFSIRPTLDGSKLKKVIGYDLPSWTEMMEDLAAEGFYQQR